MNRFTRTFLSMTGACAVAVLAWAAYARLATGGHSRDAANAAADDVVVSGQDLEAAKAAASAVELPAFADGRITYAEYRAAVDASLSCLTEQGFVVEHFADVKAGVLMGAVTRLSSASLGAGVDAHGLVTYSATGRSDRSPEENGRIVAECNRQSELLDRLWQSHLDLSEEPPQKRLDALAGCLRQAGVIVPEHPSARQLLDVVSIRFEDGVPRTPEASVTTAWQVCEQQLAIPR